jgi:hypothetical protein
MQAKDNSGTEAMETHLALTAEDVRYARPTELAKLSGYSANTWSEWTNLRPMGEFQEVRVAKELRMSLEEFRKGYRLRLEDSKRERERKHRLEKIIKAKTAS